MSGSPWSTLSAATVAGAVVYLVAMVAIAVRGALKIGGRRDDPVDSTGAAASSRFTIPVSIVLPVDNLTASISDAIDRALSLNYPEIEVIVVGHDLGPAQIQSLVENWQIEARELFYRRTLPTAAVRRIYRSALDPRVVIIDKAAGGYADAINCGINVARYRYVIALDAELSFDRNALLRLMIEPLRDPGRVVAVTQHVEQSGAFNTLASAREIARGLGSRSRGTLTTSTLVAAWRRDALLKAGGFSPVAAHPVLDLMFRLQSDSGQNGRLVRSHGIFGRLDRTVGAAYPSPGSVILGRLAVVRSLLLQGPGAASPRALARFLNAEIVAPFACAWILGVTTALAIAGNAPWLLPVSVLLMLAFGTASLSAASLLLRGAIPGAPESQHLKRLLLMSPLAFVERAARLTRLS